jgi:putative PIN family toxin of toxin-antitoxin system
VRVVLDTNVLVSGLLRPDGPPGRIVDLLLDGGFELLVDDRIVAEYEAVLPRPKFALDRRDIRKLLEVVEQEGIFVSARPIDVTLPDPFDRPFLEVALSGGADSLVTGNGRHFPAKARGDLRVEAPSDFVRRFSRQLRP